MCRAVPERTQQQQQQPLSAPAEPITLLEEMDASNLAFSSMAAPAAREDVQQAEDKQKKDKKHKKHKKHKKEKKHKKGESSHCLPANRCHVPCMQR